MKCRVQVGLALAGGYLLGRTKKMKLALILAGVTAGRGLPTRPAELLKQGSDAMRSSPELTKLVEQARGGLVDAGKSAAIAAASSRMESVSDRLSQRVSSLGPDGSEQDDEPEAEEDAATDERDAAAADDDEDQDEPEAEETGTSRRSGSRPRSSKSTRSSTRESARSGGAKRAPGRRRTSERAGAGSRRGEDHG